MDISCTCNVYVLKCIPLFMLPLVRLAANSQSLLHPTTVRERSPQSPFYTGKFICRTSLSQTTYMSLKYRCVPKRRQVLSSIAFTYYRHSPFLKSNLLTHYYSNPCTMIHLPLLVYLPIVAAVTQCISQWFCQKLCTAITTHVKFNYFMGFSPS